VPLFPVTGAFVLVGGTVSASTFAILSRPAGDLATGLTLAGFASITRRRAEHWIADQLAHAAPNAGELGYFLPKK
jgi:hypothetical protein